MARDHVVRRDILPSLQYRMRSPHRHLPSRPQQHANRKLALLLLHQYCGIDTGRFVQVNSPHGRVCCPSLGQMDMVQKTDRFSEHFRGY